MFYNVRPLDDGHIVYQHYWPAIGTSGFVRLCVAVERLTHEETPGHDILHTHFSPLRPFEHHIRSKIVVRDLYAIFARGWMEFDAVGDLRSQCECERLMTFLYGVVQCGSWTDFCFNPSGDDDRCCDEKGPITSSSPPPEYPDWVEPDARPFSLYVNMDRFLQ